MNLAIRIMIGLVVGIFLLAFFGFVIPSLIGFLIAVLLLLSINDFFSRRYRQTARTFNSAAQAVAHQEGAIFKVAKAFATRGPLSGPCYEYARRLLAGEDPIESANRSRVPLQLTTAVAMRYGGKDKPNDPTSRRTAVNRFADSIHEDSAMMPAYAHILYLVLTAIITCAMLGFVTVFIVPTIEKMFDEFGLAAPHAWLQFRGTPTQALLVLVIGSLLALTPILTTGTFFGLPIPRWMPVSPQVISDKTNVLRGLADAIDAGMTVDQSLQLAAQISLKSGQRQSLLHANSLIRQGVAPAESLRRSGLLSAGEGDWLTGASAARGAELLRWIADQRVRDARASLRWMMGIVFPALVVLLGLAVMAYSIGFFSSLVSLISGLS